MNYNHFTIDYLETIKNNLNIDFDSNCNASFYPDRVSIANIINLKGELENIWKDSISAISVIKEKREANIQLGLFGLINDLDTALKVGFMLGDRVVLIDYLFNRLLKKDPNQIDYTHLGVIASSLVNLLPLAEKGRVVIIPNPFEWHKDSKEIIEKTASVTLLTPSLMSLLNMLSITKDCKLHPYTIAESEEEYSSIINNQLDSTATIGINAGKYAYEGLLGALLTEKILNETELSIALDIPLSQYYDIISQNNFFYSKYLNILTSGGTIDSQNNIESIKMEIERAIKERDNEFKLLLKEGGNYAGLAGGLIGLLGATSILSPPIGIAGAILAFLATIPNILKTEDNSEKILISVFKNLYYHSI